MKKQYLALSLLTPVLCSALTVEARTPKENKVTNREQPNVIIILADDLGYGDLECYGAKNVQTPNVNRLAGEGIRFTNAHTIAATSTPSRYSLLTGEYAWRRPDTDVAAGNAGNNILWQICLKMRDILLVQSVNGIWGWEIKRDNKTGMLRFLLL